MLRVLGLTEDGSKDAHETLVALAKKMLRLVDERCQTQRVAFEPAADDLIHIARANRWKSSKGKDRQKVVALRRAIATKLAEKQGLVMFHVDGDVPWARRDFSENRRKLDEIITGKVRELLTMQYPEWSAKELDRRMTRLCLLMPFYSIEAWVYQNTRHAVRICQEQYGGRDVARFLEWQENREQLDEIEQPKLAVCLGSKHNHELARNAFPHRDAFQAGASFAAAVETLRACPDLGPALALTR